MDKIELPRPGLYAPARPAVAPAAVKPLRVTKPVTQPVTKSVTRAAPVTKAVTGDVCPACGHKLASTAAERQRRSRQKRRTAHAP